MKRFHAVTFVPGTQCRWNRNSSTKGELVLDEPPIRLLYSGNRRRKSLCDFRDFLLGFRTETYLGGLCIATIHHLGGTSDHSSRTEYRPACARVEALARSE